MLGVAIIGRIIFSSNNSTNNYYTKTFYTYGEDQIHTVEINTQNTDIIFESADNDEGVILLLGKNLQDNFNITQNADCLCIENKQGNTSKGNKITFYLPLWYKNKVSFITNMEKGNIKFKGAVNVENISCSVSGGDITGKRLLANKVVLKVDINHNVSIKNIVSNEKSIGNI